MWSTAVQHGPGTPVVKRAFEAMRAAGTFDPKSKDFDRLAVAAIYEERGRVKADGDLVYFSKNSDAVQAGVAKRFNNEKAHALKMLGAEPPAPATPLP